MFDDIIKQSDWKDRLEQVKDELIKLPILRHFSNESVLDGIKRLEKEDV